MSEEIDRSWHPNFVNYTESIVSHPNYKGLFYERGKDGRIKWVVTGKSANGQKRQEWWDKKCNELGIPIQKGCYAIAARLIHPTKKHVCQCCGRAMSILYEYPNKSTIKKIASALDVDIEDLKFLTISEIIEEFNEKEELNAIAKVFDLSSNLSKDELNSLIKKDFVDKCSTMLSPGVMSNPPDRFDGFHSDGLCCRERTDKGRHTDNMKTYNQDRRAYEEWADGDLNLANRLMGEFHKGDILHKCPRCGEIKRMSADHIGPISLGFRHSIFNFAPLCDSCNSAKNNRFYAKDVKRLIELECEGHVVISWHSKYIWDKLKFDIIDDNDSKRLSNIMALSHQNVLKLLSLILIKSQKGFEFLLRYLHPELCMFDYRFENFDPFDLSKLKIIKKELDSKNKRKNQTRYIRISFEALMDFALKDNRRNRYYIEDERFYNKKENIIKLVNLQLFDEADKSLRLLIDNLQEYIIENEWK